MAVKTFGEYVSFWTVVNVLVSKRVHLSDKRHKKHQSHLLSPSMEVGEITRTEEIILSLMPPRKSWVSLSTKTRFRQLDGEHRQRKSASDCNRQSIKWTIIRDLSLETQPSYIIRLKNFVDKIQTRIHDERLAFEEPLLFPEIKDESSCRPLCKFDNLEDSVILILANKYLTELFDCLFYEESLAFRSKRLYHGIKGYVTTHHDAIARIKEYRRRLDGKHLYVSECDLQKFYDTVSHRVVRKCYYGLLENILKRNPDLRFEEINRVFEAYLKCYSFPKNVYCKNQDRFFWDENRVEKSRQRFNWVEQELLAHKVAKSKRGLMQMRIGVPQGGALSGLIANMVLNTVDWKVNKHLKDSDLYLRYCDDMIIISTNKARCKKLFSIYFNGSKVLKLVPHKPEKNLAFGKKIFWKGKSKDCYPWEMRRGDAAEWIGFVGYEMRRDGMLRIRKKSFRKEVDKQISVVFEKTLDKIKDKKRVSNASLIKSLESKLISMSVGKIAVWNAPYIESEMCWSAGFKELEMNPVLKKQLKELDRHRAMILGAARRMLEHVSLNEKVVIRKDLVQTEDDNARYDAKGAVHSYYYQFARKKEGQ